LKKYTKKNWGRENNTLKKHLYINGMWKETTRYEELYAPYSGEKLADI
jgi:succinate-semialdehyde dehydrogenase/glutarate-semialdehyde dehydrogenase